MNEMMKLQKKLQEKLPPYRYHHTLGVSYTAAALAMRYDADIKKAELAGLLHDCAKYLKGEEMLVECKKYGIAINEFEAAFPELLHAKLGAYYAEHVYGVSDSEILSAIICHTTGKPNMSLLEEILFVADYIEPSREGIASLDIVRKIAFKDLHKAAFYELKYTLSHLKEKNAVIDTTTEETYEFYLSLTEG